MRKTSLYLAALGAMMAIASALAQPTAFTYQGDLKQAGQPANGLHDMHFKLFDAASGGTQIGPTQCANNVSVNAGRFTTPIDFGQQFASAAPRFLQIEVRIDTGAECFNGGGYTVLSPRQIVAPAPRALAANVASALVVPNEAAAIALVLANDGRIAAGPMLSSLSLQIAQPAPTLALQDSDSTGASGGQQIGYVSFRDNVNVERAWMGYGSVGDPDFSIVNSRILGDIVLNTFGGGRVGIGTASPLSALDVRGSTIRLGSAGQYAAVAGEENLRIVKGSVTPPTDCTVTPSISGTGFTASNLSCGEIRITFSPPFNGTPVVVGSADWNSTTGGKYVTCSNASSSGVSIRVFRTNGNNVRLPFEFMAVGPR